LKGHDFTGRKHEPGYLERARLHRSWKNSIQERGLYQGTASVVLQRDRDFDGFSRCGVFFRCLSSRAERVDGLYQGTTSVVPNEGSK
jgi:hypothetical protein